MAAGVLQAAVVVVEVLPAAAPCMCLGTPAPMELLSRDTRAQQRLLPLQVVRVHPPQAPPCTSPATPAPMGRWWPHTRAPLPPRQLRIRALLPWCTFRATLEAMEHRSPHTHGLLLDRLPARPLPRSRCRATRVAMELLSRRTLALCRRHRRALRQPRFPPPMARLTWTMP